MRTLPCLFLLFAACNRGPEIPTETENRDLDEAATMLDGADNALTGANEAALTRAEPANALTP